MYLFLDSPNCIWSFHTKEIFNFQHRLTCTDSNVIYKIDDIICKKSSIGSTTTDFKTRWQNHKSHIKKGVRSCEIASHFTEFNHLDCNTCLNLFDSNLRDILRVTIIDKVDVVDSDSPKIKIQKCKKREAYWQNQLKTFSSQGGFNKRDARTETKLKSYQKP